MDWLVYPVKAHVQVGLMSPIRFFFAEPIGYILCIPAYIINSRNMKRYNSYHTCIKQLARSNHIPQKYASNIDRSTIWRWKQESGDKYTGLELSKVHVLQNFLEQKQSEKVMKSYLRITLALSSLINRTDQLKMALRSNKEIFVRTLMRYNKNVRISDLILNFNFHYILAVSNLCCFCVASFWKCSIRLVETI